MEMKFKFHLDRRSAASSARSYGGNTGHTLGRILHSLFCREESDRFSSIRWRRPSSVTVAPRLMSSMTCAGVSAGRANNLAARFTTFGETIEVQEKVWGMAALNDRPPF
jgi:hypothetical protein